MEEEILKRAEKELSKLIESLPPDLTDFIKKMREIFDALLELEDQQKIIKMLEPLMDKIIPTAAERYFLDLLRKERIIP